ncbi:hypothetical protein [Streptomyces sp. NPDC051576]|uniref:phospholipase domain-containing protein n=1 Tax=Streptomyces sp. NPDC051576 TaxID=3155803 RepID=UPI00343176AE
MYFRMANSGSASVKFIITSSHYRGDGPWTYTVTVDSDASWPRRFTGHLESGTASVSG